MCVKQYRIVIVDPLVAFSCVREADASRRLDIDNVGNLNETLWFGLKELQAEASGSLAMLDSFLACWGSDIRG
jgi:hypothetical protein